MQSLPHNSPETTDHEVFSGIIRKLNRHITRGFVSAAAGVVTLLAVVLASVVVKDRLLEHDLQATLLVVGLIVVTLACNAYILVQYQGFKRIRDGLNKQFHVSIKQRKRAEKLYGLSILDALTGLHNRRFGEERLKEEIDRAEKTGDPLAVIVLDLDHFKEINDQFGHAAGDAALKKFAHRLRKAVRSCDVPVRIGGDEFLVILPDCPRDKLNDILSRLGTPEVMIDSKNIRIRYSVGRSHHQVTDTIKTMLKRADECLYTQKRARSSVALPTPEISNPLTVVN
jgi:diguanylate cyclase (GGDEF)-like protein